MATPNKGNITQPNNGPEYKRDEANADLPDGETHFHAWQEGGSWEFTVTTAVGLDEDTAVKIHENPHTDRNHTEHIYDKTGTDNVGTGARHDNR